MEWINRPVFDKRPEIKKNFQKMRFDYDRTSPSMHINKHTKLSSKTQIFDGPL